jgi:predicted transcriptional regulator
MKSGAKPPRPQQKETTAAIGTMTITELQNLRDELQRAIYSAAHSKVRFENREIWYQSTAEMRQALADLNSESPKKRRHVHQPTSMCNFTQFNG